MAVSNHKQKDPERMYNVRAQNADNSVSAAELDGDPANTPASTGGVPIPNHVRMENANRDTATIGSPNMPPPITQAGIYEPDVGVLYDDEGNVIGNGSVFLERNGGAATLGFEQGLWDGFLGSGTSQTLGDWGIGNEGFNDLWYDAPVFLNLWGENEGRSTALLDNQDVRTAQDIYSLTGLTQGNVGDPIDFVNTFLQNAQTPGGSYFTMSDIMSLMTGPNAEMLDGYLLQMDEYGNEAYPRDQADTLNGMIDSAIAMSVPPPMRQAYQSILNQQSEAWRTARISQQYEGTYRQWLVDSGTIQTLGGQ